MDAVKFLKEKDRLTKKCGISCLECRLSESNNKMGIPCYEMIMILNVVVLVKNYHVYYVKNFIIVMNVENFGIVNTRR